MSDEPDDLPVDPGVSEEEAAERATLQKKRQRVRRADEEAADFWRNVFADPVGRREMWEILNAAHTFDYDRFACGPTGFPQDMASWHGAGQRDFGLRLWRGWMRAVSDGVSLMMQEHDPAFRDSPKPRRRRRVNTE